MSGDIFVMGDLVDSIARNLGKDALASLSEEESNSERFRLNFLFEKVRCIICFSLVLCSTTHHGVQLILGKYQEGNPFALVEMRIHYQYTRVKSKILSFCQILLFITQQWNRVKKPFPLHTANTQPRLLALIR